MHGIPYILLVFTSSYHAAFFKTKVEKTKQRFARWARPFFFYENEWGVFRAHLRWPTSEEAAHDRFTTIRWGSVKTMSRCRGEAAAAANSLRIRRFAGRLAKPFAGEKPPALVILQMEYSE
ncbi:MAG: hypothetical protein H0Z34_14125 [Brevibacillus sp.]|nr:hypothetical protein [Brevibacillus sp.]